MPQTPLAPQPTPLQKNSEYLVKKEVFKQKHLDKNKKVFAKKSLEENNSTTSKVKSKPIKRVVKKKKTVKKPIPKMHIVKKRKTKRSKDPLANMLMGSGTSLFVQKPTSSQNSYGARMIKQLYGSEFHTFSPVQKKFIRRNLSTIHKITQRTLTRNGYPDVAKRTKQQGTNIVSFYLHPNGDISGLRLKRPIGYEALDENTLKVIRIAYKDYPLPNKKTKIIFYVNYRIY
ncbi:MAG: energy transducer TonB [Sulfurovum sp.]|nr:energy transducer TonB [Sulfurovum sp.]